MSLFKNEPDHGVADGPTRELAPRGGSCPRENHIPLEIGAQAESTRLAEKPY